MMKTVHFGSNRSYGLSTAILVYSDGQESFATIHEPKNSPDGGPPYVQFTGTICTRLKSATSASPVNVDIRIVRTF